MENTVDVSVVMPVYKVEKYIEKSVESICNQEFDGKYELVLVNDGSPDKSIDKAEMVLKRFPNMIYRIVNKENGGLPSARNYGMDYIKGKYVCFIDSDDIIAQKHIQNLYNICEKYSLAVSYADFELTYEENRKGTDSNSVQSEIIKRKELLNGFLIRSLKIHCCATLFNVSYLMDNKLRFNEKLKYGEDIEFMWRIFPQINKIGHVNAKTYKYLQRPNSIMTNQSIDKIIILCDEFKKVVDYNLKKYPEDVVLFEMLMGKAQLAFIRTSAETSTYATFNKVLDSIEYKENIVKLNNIDSAPIRILSWILQKSPRLFYWLVNMTRKVKKI